MYVAVGEVLTHVGVVSLIAGPHAGFASFIVGLRD